MPDFQLLDLRFVERLGIELLGLVLLVHPSMVRQGTSRESAFVYYMFGIGVFFVTYVLRAVEMSLGFAFGLFAIFSMLRYRTESLSAREMTSLFMVIVVSLLCAVGPLTSLELTTLVTVMVVLTLLLDRLLLERCRTQQVRYEKIENIRPGSRGQLLQDLRVRTGLDVVDVEIDSIDFMQDSAMLTVHYRHHVSPRVDTRVDDGCVNPSSLGAR